MTKLYIIHGTNEETIETDRVGDYLYGRFSTWPGTAKLYQDRVSAQTEIPLNTPEDAYALNDLQGEVYMVVHPQGLAAIGIALIAATVAIGVLKSPKKQSEAQKTSATKPTYQTGSPNNSLSARSNQERLNGRIPDIYGTVRAVPDLLTPTWIEYKNNQLIEHSYLCIGRGAYSITDIRDDDTPLSQIVGTSLEVYDPNTSPTSGSPSLTVGNAITEPLLAAKMSNSVNGQKLLAPDANRLASNDSFKFYPDGTIELISGTDQEIGSFDEYFVAGDTVTVGGTAGLNGTFVAASSGTTNLVLTGVSGAWLSLSVSGEVRSAILSTDTDRRVGPFIVDDADVLYVNVLAPNGIWREVLWQDTSGGGGGPYPYEWTQVARTLDVRAYVQQVDSSDVPFGSVFTQNFKISGSASLRTQVAKTFKVDPPFSGRMQIAFARISNKIPAFSDTAIDPGEGEVGDGILWESLQAMKFVPTGHFGNVTTVRAVTYANGASTNLKARKLNMLVTRKLTTYNNLGVIVGTNVATNEFVHTLINICLDPKIGNRSTADIDFANFHAVRNDIYAYFGNTYKVVNFNYTFDDPDLSFEEMVAIIAECCFCTAYREGNKIKLKFEKETALSKFLFNTRNKIPGSETRTVKFGNIEDKDGVELEYIDNDDGAPVQFYIPEDQSATNPETIKIPGVVDKLVARFHAYRIWNKLKYQRVSVEFDATQEALLLARGDRVQVADGTRTETQEGEVVGKVGLVLELSQPVIFEPGEDYTIFLQIPTGSIEAIAITEIAGEEYKVTLAHNPSTPVTIGSEFYAPCLYQIVKDSSDGINTFLIDERSPNNGYISSVKCLNYDDRYYANDADYINNVVDEDGN